MFRPVVALRDGSVFADAASVHETARSGQDQALAPGAVDEMALPHLDRRSTEIILARWAARSGAPRLLVNMSADAFVDSMRKVSEGWLMQALEAAEVPAGRLIIEITGFGRPWDSAVFSDAARTLRTIGARLALGDDSAGHASFRSWSKLEPEYVRVGRRWITGISSDTRRLTVVRGLCSVAEGFGTQLIAEGVDDAADLQVVLDLGIGHGQGLHLDRGAEQGGAILPASAARTEPSGSAAARPARPAHGRPVAGRSISIIQAPALSPHTTHDEVAAVFQQRPDLHALAIVDHDRPVALIARQQFMNEYSRLYFREVHGRKSCMDSANASPCVIERDDDVETLAGVLVSDDQRYLSDGFIVTEKGRYVGLGTGDQLVRIVTETRLEAARHANPLTFLPGNIPVSLHIARLLASGTAFVACHADLDNFKPFNDNYGFSRGDEMIQLTAKLVLSHCDPQRDFVGHLGGDDFMIVFQSGDWATRCESIVESFKAQARALFDEDARAAGGFEADDRHGVRRFFPCTTLSIGAISVGAGAFRHAEEVATEAALAKHEAKLAPSGIAVRIAGSSPSP